MPTTEFTGNFNAPSRILTATLSHAQPTNVIYAKNTTKRDGFGVDQQCFPPHMSSANTYPGNVIKIDAAPMSAVMP